MGRAAATVEAIMATTLLAHEIDLTPRVRKLELYEARADYALWQADAEFAESLGVAKPCHRCRGLPCRCGP